MTVAKHIASHHTRRHHLLRALRIAVGIVLAMATMIYVMEYDGSMLLLFGAELILIIACGPTILKGLNIYEAIANGGGLIHPILAFAILIVLLPVLAVIFLVIELFRAARAGRRAEL